jgi:hypothetical protein
MIIDHHQFKNALLHLSEHVQKESSDDKFFLERAILPNSQLWRIHLFQPPPENIIIESHPIIYEIGQDEISNEEIFRLSNTFIGVDKVDMALKLADWFVKTVDNISEAHLYCLLNRLPVWEIVYRTKTDSNEWLELRVWVNVEENRVVSSRIKQLPK